MTPVVQTGPNVSWLDEELRKEKALVTGLRDVIDKQQVTIADQHQRIVTLEDRLTRLEAQLLRIPEVEEALQNTRAEIVLMLSEMRQEQQKRESDFLRNRQSERELESRQIQEIQMSLGRLPALDQALAARQADGQRVHELLLRLEGRIDEIDTQIERKEEQVRQLSDAIGKNRVTVGQSLEDIAAVAKVQKGYAERMLAVESGVIKSQQDVAELQNMRRDLTQQQEALLENQRRADRARVQAMTEWGRRIEAFAHQLEGWAEQIRYFGDQHEKNRRVLREVQELSQALGQQQERLAQVQHLAEEQLRREILEVQNESARRWAQELERREAADKARGEHEDVQDGRLVRMEEVDQDTSARLDALTGALALVRQEHDLELERLTAMQLKSWKGLGQAVQMVIDTLPIISDAKEE